MSIKRLQEAGDFKPSVLAELAARQKVDLKPHVRDYMDGLFDIHRVVRDQISGHLPVWAAALAAAVSAFEERYGTSHGALWLRENDENGEMLRHVPIVPEIEDRRSELAEKASRISVSNSIVTNESWDN